MRKQYHIRASERGLLAWDVDRLILLTSELEPIDLPLESIRELEEAFWFSGDTDCPTCRRVAEHCQLINETSLDHAIVIDPEGRVMDGIHRVCKALIIGLKTIRAVNLPPCQNLISSGFQSIGCPMKGPKPTDAANDEERDYAAIPMGGSWRANTRTTMAKYSQRKP
jgi:hypothetical protein